MAVLRLILLLATFLSAAPVAANDLVGVASVIDGDTLEIHGVRIRLERTPDDRDQHALDRAAAKA